MTEPPQSIFDLIDLESFRLRPAMYIGLKSIDVLDAFIGGYQYALDSYEIKDEKNTRFERFREWTLGQYARPNYAGGWKHIILEHSRGDQEKSVDTFFELYDRFKVS